MKINPLDTQLQASNTTKTKPVENATGSDFTQILKKTVDAGNTHETAPNTMLRSSRVSPVPVIQPSADSRAMAAVEQLLNNLEQYQHLLGDTNASLRVVEPAVRRLMEDNHRLEPIVRGLAQDDPVKPFLEEAMMIASKEVARFEQGFYIDE